MAGKRQLTPIEVFEANIGDAERLIAFARALENGRRWARIERKRAIGQSARHTESRSRLSGLCRVARCVRGHQAQERGTDRPLHGEELRPLLRQAVVAISAAIESYVAEKASTYASAALASRPERLKDVMVSLDAVIEIESRYQRRRVGHRAILEAFIEREASPSPTKVGIVFSTVGQKDILRLVDAHRHVSRGTSEKELATLYRRRNKIAHTGDRTPSGRAALRLAEVDTFFAQAKSIVEAMEAVLP